MRKKKVLLNQKLSDVIFSDGKLRISKDGNEWFFEIGKEITSDLAEAVSLMMRNIDFNHPIWQIEIDGILSEEITPEKSLFWLSGGYEEWRTLEHYVKPWSECCLDFQEEFGLLIINCLKRSKKLEDLRDYFTKYLNLPIIYDFAISKNLVR